MARYKVLKSVAHSVGHSFTSLLNYAADDYVMGLLLRTARETGVATLSVDLLTGEAGPPALLVPAVKRSVASYVARFPTLVRSHRTDMRYVRAARLTLSFDLAVRRPARYAPDCEESPFLCSVDVEDDRGKLWHAEIRDWWFPEPDRPKATPASTSHVTRLVLRLGQVIRSVWHRSVVAEAAF